MDTPITAAQVEADPTCLAFTLPTAWGASLTFRPLQRQDAQILGQYFLGLSEDTKRRYGPHPFDQATADQLCANLNYADTIRMIAVLPGEAQEKMAPQEQVIVYFILQLNVPESEIERYAQANIRLDSETGCLIAPSLADAYQNRGLGTPLMRHMFSIARRLGRKQMILMGGVYAYNERAVHYYQKTGFILAGSFMPTWSNAQLSYDMYINLIP